MGIFDDLVQQVNKEIGRVQNKSQEMLQSYTLTSQIRSLERKKAAILVEIGHVVFDKYQRGADVSEEALRSKTMEILECEREITVMQAELESLRMQSDPDASASQRAEAKAGYHPSSTYTCPRCESPADLGKSFCPSCGASLKDAQAHQEDHRDAAGHTCDDDCGHS